LDQDEIWWECSLSKYTSVDGVRFDLRSQFQGGSHEVISFHATKCYHLVSKHEASAGTNAAASVSTINTCYTHDPIFKFSTNSKHCHFSSTIFLPSARLLSLCCNYTYVCEQVNFVFAMHVEHHYTSV